jgi:hypothetical protein
MAQRISTVLPGQEPLEGMTISHLGGAEYKVLSVRNGPPRVHSVDLGGPSCSCEDMDYNRDDPEVCAHICKAMLVHDSYLDVEANMASVLMNMTATVDDHVQKAADAAEAAEDALVKARDVQAGQAAAEETGGSQPSPDNSTGSQSESNDTDQALATTEEWVGSQFTKPDLVDLKVNERTVQGRSVMCVELDCDYDAQDAAHETWQGIMSSKDKVMWDGDAYVNYVPVPEVSEVFG